MSLTDVNVADKNVFLEYLQELRDKQTDLAHAVSTQRNQFTEKLALQKQALDDSSNLAKAAEREAETRAREVEELRSELRSVRGKQAQFEGNKPKETLYTQKVDELVSTCHQLQSSGREVLARQEEHTREIRDLECRLRSSLDDHRAQITEHQQAISRLEGHFDGKLRSEMTTLSSELNIKQECAIKACEAACEAALEGATVDLTCQINRVLLDEECKLKEFRVLVNDQLEDVHRIIHDMGLKVSADTDFKCNHQVDTMTAFVRELEQQLVLEFKSIRDGLQVDLKLAAKEANQQNQTHDADIHELGERLTDLTKGFAEKMAAVAENHDEHVSMTNKTLLEIEQSILRWVADVENQHTQMKRTSDLKSLELQSALRSALAELKKSVEDIDVAVEAQVTKLRTDHLELAKVVQSQASSTEIVKSGEVLQKVLEEVESKLSASITPR
uniref:Uncharacterized protein n=1 Tax=Noctiluca scintillans TaxID=2966 RepID=A0A7S1A8U9_NOCSC|mmetsp:Transcript_36220/g.96231  ORF Transcript_36220/g.96231 Transcript_36220/m.96231 type:complete len:445 (+) Transcript_36220:41-1375(+)